MSAPTIGLVERVRSRLAAAGGDTDPAAVAAAVRAESGGVASDLDVLAALRTLRQEFTGAGPLDELLRDPRTTDVLVCGPAGVLFAQGPFDDQAARDARQARQCRRIHLHGHAAPDRPANAP